MSYFSNDIKRGGAGGRFTQENSSKNFGLLFTIPMDKPKVRHWSMIPDETPRADPHAGWCGSWGSKTPTTQLVAFRYNKLPFKLRT